ncbi:hypothetical protein GCM10023189_27350 [Nibrella saemangeumensis]|uniref:DUF3024 domain-containing protein n=1 Tax=Nibrella saemangeumensis TaxID=1084526 RepID=A0ABP8MZ35_9BACT
MALDPIKTVDIIELMENYLERIRPPESIREQLDIGYRIDNQSIILFETRPQFRNPEKKMETDYAKATYVKSENKWKVYWMRGNMNWTLYEPKPRVSNLKRFLELVDEDKYHCFKG